MGISLSIFSFYQLRDEIANCNHYLLTKVERQGFNNADEGEYDYVIEAADKKKIALIEVYKAQILADECAGLHTTKLVGELQGYPVGEELLETGGGSYIDLWIAETEFGAPWVVLGTAANEETFWNEIEENEDLSCLRPIRPAVKHQVFFLADRF